MKTVAYYASDGVEEGWYCHAGGIDTSDPLWALAADPGLHGPFSSEDEAAEYLENYLAGIADEYLSGSAPMDAEELLRTLRVACAHGQEMIEADRAHLSDEEFVRKQFQVALRTLYDVAAHGNPPACVVNAGASNLLQWLTAAYPGAFAEFARKAGNHVRRAYDAEEVKYGEST